MTNQSSCFTIHNHPNGQEQFEPLENQESYITKLRKFIIPEQFKLDILNELYMIGIHRAFIYPGIEGISNRIKYELETKHKRST